MRSVLRPVPQPPWNLRKKYAASFDPATNIPFDTHRISFSQPCKLIYSTVSLFTNPVPGRGGDEHTHNQIAPLAPSPEDTPPGQVSGVGKHAYLDSGKSLISLGAEVDITHVCSPSITFS